MSMTMIIRESDWKIMKHRDLLTKAEFARFSPEARERVNKLLGD